MKRAALILAGAAAFDLGVMAVAAQAQQAGAPPVRIPTTSTGPTFPGPGEGGAVVDPTGPGGNGGCTPGGVPRPGRPSEPCAPAAISDQAAQGNLTSFMRTSPSDELKIKMLGTTYIKVDRVNTIQACRARQGEVVMHEGAQQCRITAPEAPAVGNPLRNRPIPPR
ncbi:MAG: hypothetical protein K2Y04_13240 [Caulobacteraceae bacterium]|nr:hypothetical protein [Caulobacteraceae bacterium]